MSSCPFPPAHFTGGLGFTFWFVSAKITHPVLLLRRQRGKFLGAAAKIPKGFSRAAPCWVLQALILLDGGRKISVIPSKVSNKNAGDYSLMRSPRRVAKVR